MEKLSFTIDNIELIDDNPDSSFSLLSLDFFASGANKHDMYVSEETLLKKADTIKNCPVVWQYDPQLDDIGTHGPEETPCGFIPQDTEIKSRKLVDGRTMLTTLSYVWKKYSGDLLKFFKRDGAKPISVEMSLFDSELRPDKLRELKDFKFEAVTILGSFVTPAIPMATATVLQFSKEYQDAYEKEFVPKYPELDFLIPIVLKDNARIALEKADGHATAVSTTMARYLVKNEKITPEKIYQMVQFFSRKPEYIEPSIDFYGGKEGAVWSKALDDAIALKRVSYFDTGKEITFPYKTTGEMNPALKGITPPITAEQGTTIAAQADAIGGEYGWPTAIKHFKDTHKVEDGKWVEKSKEEKMADEITKPKEEMAVEVPKEEMAFPVEEKPKEEMAFPVEEKPKDEKKFEFPKNFNLETMSRMFSDDEDEDDVKMAKEELKKGEFAEPGIVMAGMFAKMCKMAAIAAKMAEENKAYMAENEELKKFKAESESARKFAQVDKTLAELSEKVVIPDEAMAEFRASAENFSFENIGAWENECKAKSFDFAVKKLSKEDKIEKIGLPFNSTGLRKPSNDVWAGAK